jgi:hypothetical protein
MYIQWPSVSIGQEAGRAPELVWTQRLEEKSFVSAGDRNLIVRSAVRHVTFKTLHEGTNKRNVILAAVRT